MHQELIPWHGAIQLGSLKSMGEDLTAFLAQGPTASWNSAANTHDQLWVGRDITNARLAIEITPVV